VRQDKTKFLWISYLTAFVGGFCVMALEIIAGRLVARYLGVSLYTWTSVIGVVLLGISIGNYIGGRIADRFSPQRAISVLFILASVSCVVIPALNNLMGNLPLLLPLSWPLRIFLHVAIIFFLPSFILGAISPVIAKFALEQGFKMGRTIGNIYAWQSAGSILGTFITGFFLIGTIGSSAGVGIIALVLGIMGLFFYSKISYLWLVGIIFLGLVANHLFLKEKINNVVYAKDSFYSYISIIKEPGSGVSLFKLDGLAHSKMNLDEPTNPDYIYGYQRIYLDLVRNFSPERKGFSVLLLGGGGYVFPRFLENYFPQSYIQVVEIDPEVTKTAIKAFCFQKKDNLKIYHLDARNFIEDLFRQKKRGERIEVFDFIFCDVVFGLAVPYHLVTYEFNEKIKQLLKPEGRYIMTVVDSRKSPMFLKAVINTLSKTFSYVYVFVPKKEEAKKEGTETYVILASLNKIDKDKFTQDSFSGKLLDEELLKKSPGEILLTDDFSPVDNLLKEAFSSWDKERICSQIMETSQGFIEKGELKKAIFYFKKVVSLDPYSADALSNIGSLMAWQERFDEAIVYYQKALSIEPKLKPANIGLANAYVGLGNTFFKKAEFDQAISYYKKALEIEPGLEVAQENLAIAIKEKERR
jgi:spermidine synthase